MVDIILFISFHNIALNTKAIRGAYAAALVIAFAK
jgi:hypothetical protein